MIDATVSFFFSPLLIRLIFYIKPQLLSLCKDGWFLCETLPSFLLRLLHLSSAHFPVFFQLLMCIKSVLFDFKKPQQPNTCCVCMFWPKSGDRQTSRSLPLSEFLTRESTLNEGPLQKLCPTWQQTSLCSATNTWTPIVVTATHPLETLVDGLSSQMVQKERRAKFNKLNTEFVFLHLLPSYNPELVTEAFFFLNWMFVFVQSASSLIVNVIKLLLVARRKLKRKLADMKAGV